MHTVTLTARQAAYADQVAESRHYHAVAQGWVPRWGQSRLEGEAILQNNREGARGEAAVLALFAASLRRRGFTPIEMWPTFQTNVDDPLTDVAGWEVRATSSRRLIIHPSDKDEKPYVLVTTSDYTTFIIRGWLYGREGKNLEWWWDQARHPAFFVPPTALTPIPDEWLA